MSVNWNIAIEAHYQEKVLLIIPVPHPFHISVSPLPQEPQQHRSMSESSFEVS